MVALRFVYGKGAGLACSTAVTVASVSILRAAAQNSLLPLRLYRSSGVSSLGGGGSSHGIILPVPASSARGARVLLSR